MGRIQKARLCAVGGGGARVEVRKREPETPKASRGVGNGEWSPSLSDCGVWEASYAPQRGPGRSPSRIRISVLLLSKHHRMLLVQTFVVNDVLAEDVC